MALPNAAWTGQKIVDVVARNFGLNLDTDSRVGVLDLINQGLWEVSLETPWEWNERTQDDITVEAATAEYNLATGDGTDDIFDEIYDVRLTGDNERTLEPLNRRTYDRFRRRYQSTANIPTHYFIYNKQNNAKITLVPTPSAADVLTIRYIRNQEIIADATASSLAVPNKYIPLLIYKANELVAGWQDPEQVAKWRSKYRYVLMRALDKNRNKPDQMAGFVPRIEHEGEKTDYINPDDLTWYPRQ